MIKKDNLGPSTDYNSGSIYMSVNGYQDLIKTTGGKNLYWTTDINVELPIKMQSTGVGSTIKPDIIPNAFKKTASLRKDAPAMYIMRNKKEYMWTWN